MAQTGFEPSLMSKVGEGGVVDRMLTRSAGLDAHFVESSHVAEDGRVFIVPDETRIANVARKVAFGLFCHRYTPDVLPDLHDFLALKPVHNLDNSNFIFVMIHNERFRPRRWKHVQTLISEGKRRIQVFDYMFVRNQIGTDLGRLFCIMRFHETLWAAVRCPHPSNRKNAKRRVGSDFLGQSLLPLSG